MTTKCISFLKLGLPTAALLSDLALTLLPACSASTTPPADSGSDQSVGAVSSVNAINQDAAVDQGSQKGVTMKDGKMMVVNADSDASTKDMTMTDGTKVMMDGKVTKADGTSVMMKNGDAMGVDGAMMKSDAMMKAGASTSESANEYSSSKAAK